MVFMQMLNSNYEKGKKQVRDLAGKGNLNFPCAGSDFGGALLYEARCHPGQGIGLFKRAAAG